MKTVNELDQEVVIETINQDEDYKDYDLVDPVYLGQSDYKKRHDCKRSGCTVCVAFEH
jgi:hypothetical protein